MFYYERFYYWERHSTYRGHVASFRNLAQLIVMEENWELRGRENLGCPMLPGTKTDLREFRISLPVWQPWISNLSTHRNLTVFVLLIFFYALTGLAGPDLNFAIADFVSVLLWSSWQETAIFTQHISSIRSISQHLAQSGLTICIFCKILLLLQ